MATLGRLRSTRLLVFLLLLASLVTITIDARGGERGPLAAASRVLGGIIGPLQEGVSAIFRPIGAFFSNVFQAGSLAERVTQLETENAELQTQLQETSELIAENAEYEAILEIAADQDFGLLGANVVAAGSVSNLEWSVTIDKGRDDGVIEDMPVVGPSGLVGRVVRTFDTAAQVMLIIDPGSTVTARLSSSRETGLIEGQGEELLRFSLVDPEAEIIPGEVVETSGFQFEGYTGIYPSGIPIGVVDAVEPADDGVTVSVTVRPNMRFSQLDKLGLVTGVPDLAQEIRNSG